MNIRPMQDRLLIKPVDDEQKTAGGIIVPDTAKEKPSMGKVVAVGTDDELKELIKVGDKVIYGKYAGEEIKIEGVKNLLISRSDILAKIN